VDEIMTRKRANKQNKTTEVSILHKDEKVFEIAPNKPKVDVIPLNTKDGETLQEMVNLNNTYSGLLKQQSQYDAMIFMLKIRRDDILKGKIGLPVMVKITNTMSYAESNKEKVLKNIDDEIKNYQLARDGLDGTIQYRRDGFKESMLRVLDMLKQRTKDLTVENIAGLHLKSVEIKEAEKKALEKEFDELIKKEEKKKE
jgi:hypothetical protein